MRGVRKKDRFARETEIPWKNHFLPQLGENSRLGLGGRCRQAVENCSRIFRFRRAHLRMQSAEWLRQDDDFSGAHPGYRAGRRLQALLEPLLLGPLAAVVALRHERGLGDFHGHALAAGTRGQGTRGQVLSFAFAIIMRLTCE